MITKSILPLVAFVALVGCRSESVEGSCTLANYLDYAREVLDTRGSVRSHADIPAWDKKARYEVLCFNAEMLSYRAEDCQYTGGAHGSTAIAVGSISRKTGLKFMVSDFVPVDCHDELLRQIREDIAKRHYGKQSYAELRKEAALLAEPQLTENFYLDVRDKTLHFIYNQYEIACYADGIIEAIVPLGTWE